MVILGTVLHMFDQREAAQDFLAAQGMGLHNRVFFVRQPAGLVQDIVRNRNLADIMHAGCLVQVFAFFFAEAHPFRDQDRVFGNTFRMLAGTHVLGVNGVGDGHDGLIAHPDLQVRAFDRTLEPQIQKKEAEDHRPCDDIDDKPGLVVDVFLLDDLVGTFFDNRGLIASEYGKMEEIGAGREIRV